ncbi:hypothetical protein IP92_02930 [Pseudoduganella flava]|uniref:Uncharacterized protein n=1 Tax=Pseudoduganella flava TaxID=871742 RepID=A0A562PQ42_9BURK|nr:hypothetical protein [Pseudoduganella flava]QGZ37762.1 hypothetical protein GO485_00950 [Pseudoduganella flava]TWI46571.1 hypothetical protein IP92_02930 [Pseudoduganella flava]
MSKGIKYTAMAAALGVVANTLQRTADVYGTLNSQDANYRDLQQQVAAALNLPEDPDADTPPPPVVLAAMTPEQVEHAVTRMTAAAASADVADKVIAEIERSDHAVMDALAQTRADILASVVPATEPAAATA